MADSLFVCRPADVETLRGHLASAVAGSTRAVVVESPLGGGKRAAVGELVRGINASDTLVVRIALSDEEDGLKTVLRIYGALYGALYREPQLKGRVELSLNGLLPSQPKRVQGWIQAFIEGLKKSAPTPGEDSFQVSLPRDNPVTGLGEIIAAVASKIPVVLDLQNVFNSHSIATFAMLESLIDRKDLHLLLLLGNETVDETARSWMPAPWLDLLDRRADQFEKLVLAPWGADEVAAYAASKGFELAAPARVAELTHGRPAYVSELCDLLNDKGLLGDDLASQTLLSLTPTEPDASDLEEAPEHKEGERKYATAESAPRIQYLCALLGLGFPSGLVADMDGWDRDSVDDLLDASEDLVKELQFSKGLNTWVYQFQKGIFRQAILDANATPEGHELAQRVATFLERFLVPRGYEFIVKTQRIYADHGAPGRAVVLRSMALGADRPDIWAMTQDHIKYHAGIAWPEPMRRTVYLNLVERLVQNGDPDQSEKLLQEALAWAKERNDGFFTAWLTFAGSRLDFRRQDMYRARDRAKDALRGYTELGDKGKIAEIENHLALVEHQDGNANAALEHIRLALEAMNTPPVQANAEFIRGLIARGAKKPADAAEHFRRANEIGGNVGMAPLALEAGFFYGEALVASQQVQKAADVLLRVAQIAQSLQNAGRERATVALLAQVRGMLHQYEGALQMAQRSLQLTQELKLERFVPMDVFNVAFFQLQLGRNTEAHALLGKARAMVSESDDANFRRELHLQFGVAALRIGEQQQAIDGYTKAVALAQTTKAWPRLIEAAEALADLHMARGQKAEAAKLLQQAMQAADAGNLREERKGLRRKLEDAGGV